MTKRTARTISLIFDSCAMFYLMHYEHVEWYVASLVVVPVSVLAYIDGTKLHKYD